MAVCISAWLLTLSACGFHLRGYGESMLDLPPVALTFSDTAFESEWDYALRRQLKRVGVTVSDNAPIQMRILSITTEKNTVSYDRRGKAAEYEITQSINFMLEAPNKTLSSDADHSGPATFSLSRNRVFTFDPSNINGKAQEERLLRREIQSELIREMIHRLNEFGKGIPAITPDATSTSNKPPNTSTSPNSSNPPNTPNP